MAAMAAGGRGMQGAIPKGPELDVKLTHPVTPCTRFVRADAPYVPTLCLQQCLKLGAKPCAP